MAGQLPQTSASRASAGSEDSGDLPTVPRPYVTPKLQHLGSVRDVTLAASGGNGELAGGKKKGHP
jgi:hypothetical protein